jgi:hypothetical protein
VPLLQTIPLPHIVPFGLSPDAVHTALPVSHEVVPILHRSPGSQAAPATQSVQAPPLHTLSCPQKIPSSAGIWVSVQDASAPPEQTA